MESFTLLPLTIDKVTNAVLAPSSTPSLPALPDAISDLNTLHRSMLQFENAIPPPPGLINPKRSAQINKLRESGNAAFRKQAFGEAVKLYSLALEIAQANIAMRNWAEGMCDAEMSCGLKPKDNVKAWYRRALCLKEMGKLEDSREVLEMGCEWEAENQGKTDGDLRALLRDVHKALEEKEKIAGAA
ncbi:hypothetical protein TWF970_007161 [Orbilia oligospora]|uniref:Translocation protein sec72 n=1 Tax=Orbilia oligospora TaxID=2813651 RepID=A0A7C8RM44_ORBOL|nr:hypothetical protein TWF970_007161 [Orbilia oligospora]